MTATLPANTPIPVPRTATQLVRQGYTVAGLVWHPGYREPLLKLHLNGPRWFLLWIGVAWLVAWTLYRVPFTRSAGAALLRHRATPAPIVYIDATGVAH